MKKKIVYLIIGLIIIINILILAIFLSKKPPKTENLDLVNISEPKTITENNEIYPEGSYQLVYRYSGKTDPHIIYKAIYNIVDYLNAERIVKLSDTEAEKMYQNESKQITEKCKIDNLNDFKKLVKQAKTYSKYGKYTTIKFLDDTFKKETHYTTIQMVIILSDKEQLKFKIYIGNLGKYKDDVKIVPII